MRVSKIEFHRYQRLRETVCWVNGKVLAFVGPNETGKTTVLRALEWFSGGAATPERVWRRYDESDPTKPLVRITYSLDEGDLDAIKDLYDPKEYAPLLFRRSKHHDGHVTTKVMPDLQRAPQPFVDAEEVLQRAIDRYSEPAASPLDDEGRDWLDAHINHAKAILADREASWNDEWSESFDELVDWLATSPETGEGEDQPAPPDLAAAKVLRAVQVVLKEEHPDSAMRRRLSDRTPTFVMFGDHDRSLRSSYDLSDPEIRAAVPKALAHLLANAGLSVDDLWRSIDIEGETADKSTERTLTQQANRRLSANLGTWWSQRDIDVQLNLTGYLLEVEIHEQDHGGRITPVDERSDGLLMFIALAAFLARGGFAVPPVLLIDEAETHLHYDAQADIVNVLSDNLGATHAFYTTHSPGCLPRDLGTGIRLVVPAAEDARFSELRSDFWSFRPNGRETPGFTPLLFSMGASAAAFSVLRRAVLTEGPSDMILLPSLLKLATESADLSYQVAPGLSRFGGNIVDLQEVAARVVFLVDGDEGGAALDARLQGLGIEPDHIFALPAGQAIEDLVEQDLYLEIVNMHLADAPNFVRPITVTDLDSSLPVAKSVDNWCVENGVSPPVKPAVAEALVTAYDGEDAPRLRLAPGADMFLMSLHRDLESRLG